MDVKLFDYTQSIQSVVFLPLELLRKTWRGKVIMVVTTTMCVVVIVVIAYSAPYIIIIPVFLP